MQGSVLHCSLNRNSLTFNTTRLCSHTQQIWIYELTLAVGEDKYLKPFFKPKPCAYLSM